MTIQELQDKIAEHQEWIDSKASKGALLTFGPDGPVGMPVIRALAETLETQAQKIDQLKQELAAIRA